LFGFPKYQDKKSWYSVTSKAQRNSSKMVWGQKSAGRLKEIDLDKY